jgi:hypothetical protein
MEGIWILVGLITYLKLNKTLLKFLHLEPSSRNLITYALLGFLVSAIIMFFSYDKSSKGSLFVFIFYVLGLSVQIAYWYFKKPRTINFAHK